VAVAVIAQSGFQNELENALALKGRKEAVLGCRRPSAFIWRGQPYRHPLTTSNSTPAIARSADKTGRFQFRITEQNSACIGGIDILVEDEEEATAARKNICPTSRAGSANGRPEISGCCVAGFLKISCGSTTSATSW
jgi:hypothetical protein